MRWLLWPGMFLAWCVALVTFMLALAVHEKATLWAVGGLIGGFLLGVTISDILQDGSPLWKRWRRVRQ